MSYSAIVAPITVRKHPNADKLQIGVVAGNQVVVGLDVVDGQLGVFFPTDGQLSHEMCAENRLYSESACAELGLNALFGEHFGFFSANRRVRSQKFRGEKSDGFWCELDKLVWTGANLSKLASGTPLTELNGHAICNRYETEATKKVRAANAKQGKGRKQLAVVFPKHVDSAQFRFNVKQIPAGSIIYISEKLHGTSGRFGNVRETIHPTGIRKLLRFKPKAEWHHFNGSRNIVLERTAGEGFYGTNEFRYRMTKDLSLHKGEIIFFELVGYTGPDSLIMSPQPIQDKSMARMFGATMRYTYATVPGQCSLYVYRIARLNEDGVETELSQLQMEARARELGLQTVPVLRGPLVYTGAMETLTDLVEELTSGVTTIGAAHIREGVVVRIEQPDGLVKFLKNKSFEFGVLEGYLKSEDVIDIEEAA